MSEQLNPAINQEVTGDNDYQRQQMLRVMDSMLLPFGLSRRLSEADRRLLYSPSPQQPIPEPSQSMPETPTDSTSAGK